MTHENIESSMHGVKSDRKPEIDRETEAAKAKIYFRKLLKDLNLTPQELEKMAHEIVEEEKIKKVYEIGEENNHHPYN